MPSTVWPGRFAPTSIALGGNFARLFGEVWETNFKATPPAR
jgi:hypothetical protein